MVRRRTGLLVVLAAVLLLGAGSGTTINGSREILGDWDASGAHSTKPFRAGTSPSATCEVSEGFFDTDAVAGENILLCTATDTWTAIPLTAPTGVTGTGTEYELAYWVAADMLGTTAGAVWDGVDRLSVPNLTVTNTIVGSVDGTAASLQFLSGPPLGCFGYRVCSLNFALFLDKDCDGSVDTEDFCVIDGGIDGDCNCTADTPLNATQATKLANPLASGAYLWNTPFTDWIKWDYFEQAAETVPVGGMTGGSVDSNGDGTVDLDVQNIIAGFKGDGTSKQRFAIFPGGYSSDPFDYTSGFVFEDDSPSGAGAFYPIVSDPNYATLGADPIADLGTSTYKWRSGYFSDLLYVATASFNNLGYSNSGEGTASLFWNANNGQRWAVDADSDNTAHQTFVWGYGNTPTVQMRLDHDSTPEWWVDLDTDGTPDIRFDGTDEPAHAEQLTWDSTANAARWTAPGVGSGTSPDVSEDGTVKKADFTVLNFGLGFDVDGTANVTLDFSEAAPTLDQIGNPAADKAFTMANKQLKFTYTAPATADGGFEVEALGGFSGDLMHVHQHTGNPGAGTDLLHLEAVDADVLPLRIIGAGTRSVIADDPIEITQATGTAPLVVASTTEVANLRSATASALAADPADCGANTWATTIAASGALTCSAVSGGAGITDGTILVADLTWDDTTTKAAGQHLVIGTDTTKVKVAGDMVMTVWHYENAPASGTSYMTPSDTTSMLNMTVPYDATFKALSCSNNAVISAGTLTFAATYGATPTTSDLTVQQTTGTAAFAGIQDTTCTSNCAVTAGTRIRISMVAAGTVAPITTDPSCTLIMTIP